MKYIGIDMVEIARIEQAVARWGEAFLSRIYTGAELAQYQHHPASLAARFAAKEAVVKVLGTLNDRGFRWKDVEILSAPSGKPVVNLYGQAKTHAERLGIADVVVSLSHSKEYAIALAAGESMAESNQGGQ